MKDCARTYDVMMQSRLACDPLNGIGHRPTVLLLCKAEVITISQSGPGLTGSRKGVHFVSP